jgi:hypothetical protein
MRAFAQVIYRGEATFCVAIGGADPDSALLAQLAGGKVRVVAASECSAPRSIPTDAEGRRAIRFRVTPARAVERDEAIAEVGWNTGNSLAGDAGYEYTLARQGAVWSITNERMLWIS